LSSKIGFPDYFKIVFNIESLVQKGEQKIINDSVAGPEKVIYTAPAGKIAYVYLIFASAINTNPTTPGAAAVKLTAAARTTNLMPLILPPNSIIPFSILPAFIKLFPNDNIAISTSRADVTLNVTIYVVEM
jgi:hypothetical protein